ncbi:hypothetical protein TSUD_126120 [Trifolium subterraneum]|uniref:Uncharacterized protein n=1 Tax=Trifolium subterraneum TaxID=3900 RepID=A0A2Z6M6B0_TRISU|nr:hypothetical protein TSUD_126120 [Trifolium subterraneum]
MGIGGGSFTHVRRLFVLGEQKQPYNYFCIVILRLKFGTFWVLFGVAAVMDQDESLGLVPMEKPNAKDKAKRKIVPPKYLDDFVVNQKILRKQG